MFYSKKLDLKGYFDSVITPLSMTKSRHCEELNDYFVIPAHKVEKVNREAREATLECCEARDQVNDGVRESALGQGPLGEAGIQPR